MDTEMTTIQTSVQQQQQQQHERNISAAVKSEKVISPKATIISRMSSSTVSNQSTSSQEGHNNAMIDTNTFLQNNETQIHQHQQQLYQRNEEENQQMRSGGRNSVSDDNPYTRMTQQSNDGSNNSSDGSERDLDLRPASAFALGSTIAQQHHKYAFGNDFCSLSSQNFRSLTSFAAENKHLTDVSFVQKSASCHRIDEMLKTAMDDFHREGPLVNPLRSVKPGGSERHKNRHAFGGESVFSGGSWMVDSPMCDRMAYVCESKGFDYGMFWKLDRQRTSVTPAEFIIAPRNAVDTGRLSLFISTSRSLFTRFVLGFGMPGRVAHSGNYEWHEDISLLPAWSFQRKTQAERAAIKTIICVPIEKGVVEFGLTDEKAHDVSVVQYVQKMCKSSV